MRYTLWHLNTGNLIGDFDDKGAAFAAVRNEIRANNDAEQLMLEDEEEPSAEVLFGHELEQIAFESERRPALW